jgi:class 3 adenylate cyclase
VVPSPSCSAIEGSTRLVKALRDRYAQVLAEHRRLVRAAIAGHRGHEVDTQGDAFFAAFGEARQAVLCALEIQQSLGAHDWPEGTRVRSRSPRLAGRADQLRRPAFGLGWPRCVSKA